MGRLRPLATYLHTVCRGLGATYATPQLNLPISKACPWGFSPALQAAFGLFRERCYAMGLPDPWNFVISGYRSPTTQRELQRRWDEGKREGLAVRPGDPETSRHCQGTAFDLEGAFPLLQRWGEVWTGLGYRWGGHIIPHDPNHYDMG